MIKLKNILTEESAMKAIINAKKGAKASGGGYSSWTKIGNNSWKNKKTGRLSHNAGLYDKIGEFSDFVIEGKVNEYGGSEFSKITSLQNYLTIDLTEDAVASFTKELNGERIKAKVYTATGDGKTVEAQFTNKKWEDGVPVTKNLTRGGYKSLKTPRGKFKVIETDKFFYYEINNGWAAVSRKRYTTPPFEY